MDTNTIAAENRLIDRYINGTLTGVERTEFIEKMDKDSGFRDRVAFRNAVVEGIRAASDQQLQYAIIQSINYRKPLIPFGLRLLMTFIFVVAISLLVWNYLGTDSPQSFRFKWFAGKGTEQTRKKIKSEKVKDAESQFNTEIVVLDSTLDTLAMDEQLASTTADSMAEAAGDIVVKKDQLLAAYALPVQQVNSKSGVTSKENQLSQEAAQRLNPSAGLPVEEANQNVTYQVEFWESPVNYRGYKRMGNSIVLYGILQADDVTLFQNNGKLILRSGSDYFELKPGDAFQSYHPIKDPELSALLK